MVGQANTNDPHLVSALQEALKTFRINAEVDSLDDFDPDTPSVDAVWPSYIHLTDALIYSGSNLSPIGAALWRGKLISVDGWQLGSITPG